jgi:hypothetical protein
MSCRVALQRECDWLVLSEEQLATFLELARRGDEFTFKDLARCLGVQPGAVDGLWTGTVARFATPLGADENHPPPPTG